MGSKNTNDLNNLQKELLATKSELEQLKSDYAALHVAYRNKEIYLYNILKADMPVTFYWKDKNSVALGCNQMQATIFNLSSPDEYIGKDTYYWCDYYGWDRSICDAIRENDVEVMETGKTLVREEEVILNDKKKIFLSYKNPLLSESGETLGMFGFSVDITERKEAEMQLLAAKEKAEEASHAKSEFIRNMSHDIRTPLTGIIGISDQISRSPKANITKDSAHDINQAARALLNLLNEIIETTQLDSGDMIHKKSCFKLKATMDALIAIFNPTIKYKGLKLEIYYDDNIPQLLYGQELLLHRIALNLLGNAVKFTDKGTISLEISLLQKKSDKVSLKLVIKDTGIGIPADKQEIIFDKFSRLTSSYTTAYKGTGLGLYMVKEFIKKLGGDIKVTSALGKGAQFTCTVQFKIPTGAQLKKYQLYQVAQENFKMPFNKENIKIKILLVEDNELVQKATIFNFQSWGYDAIDIATTGESAIKYSLTKKYDLIYLDLGLPDMNGKEVAKGVRSNAASPNQTTPIIALTAHADEKVKQECATVQINKVLLKPLLEEDFRKNIAEFLSHTQSLPVLDLLLWQKRSGDDELLAKETQQIIFQELPELKSKTSIALQEKDYAAFNALIQECYHELLYCGLPALESATALLVQAIQEKHTDQLQNLHQNFCHEIDRVLKK